MGTGGLVKMTRAVSGDRARNVEAAARRRPEAPKHEMTFAVGPPG